MYKILDYYVQDTNNKNCLFSSCNVNTQQKYRRFDSWLFFSNLFFILFYLFYFFFLLLADKYVISENKKKRIA